MRDHRTVRLAIAFAGAACLVAACADEKLSDASPEGSSSSSGGSTTDAVVETTGAGPESSAGTTIVTSGSTDAPDPGTSSGDDSAGFITPPDGGTGGGMLGICIGVQEVGHLGTVHTELEPGQTPVCDPTPMNCGSDPVGTWTVRSHCGFEALPNFFASQCPDSTMQFLGSDVAGTRTFHEDLTFEYDTTLVIDVEAQLDPMECFGASCAAFGTALDGEQNIEAVCEEDESGCACLLSITQQVQSEGTYAVTEDGLELTADGALSGPFPFCRQDEELRLWEPITSSEPHPEVTCEAAQDCIDAFADDPTYAEFEWFCVEN